MEQQGYIIEIIDEKTAKLKIQRHSACVSCGKCFTTSQKKHLVIEVDNSIGAKVGDRVSINMESINILKAVGTAYIFPLISLLMGTIGSYYILQLIDNVKNIEIISSMIGIVIMLLSFFILKKNDNKFRQTRQYIPVITKIIVLQDK